MPHFYLFSYKLTTTTVSAIISLILELAMLIVYSTMSIVVVLFRLLIVYVYIHDTRATIVEDNISLLFKRVPWQIKQCPYTLSDFY